MSEWAILRRREGAGGHDVIHGPFPTRAEAEALLPPALATQQRIAEEALYGEDAILIEEPLFVGSADGCR